MQGEKMNYRILAVNPGSTSTKASLYENEKMLFLENLKHTAEDLGKYESLTDQAGFRAETVHSLLEKHGVALSEISAVAGRGGLLPNMLGGGYLVTETMTSAILQGDIPYHASNLGALIALEMAKPLGINAYIYDAVTANEFPEIAIVTGIPEIRRQSMCHVLNAKAMSRKVAKKHGREYEQLRLIVVHLGGGVSISAHENGKIIDALGDDSGPFFAPERSGAIPTLSVIEMCYSGKYTKKEMLLKVRGNGGLKAYFGTADGLELENMANGGDEKAKFMLQAMAYQIAKGIGEMAAVLNGKVDFIVLTGGLARFKMLTSWIAGRSGWIAPVEIEPGEDEMESLSLGVLRILKGEEKAKEYQRINGIQQVKPAS
jgi:butyrate kinase